VHARQRARQIVATYNLPARCQRAGRSAGP